MEEISEEVVQENEENVENKEEKNEIVIHIAGEVKNPGIVRINEGARIADIIEQAGGLTEFANITNINLAYIVEDGQKIIIPKQGEQEENKEYITSETGEGIIQENGQSQSTGNTKININKAGLEELQQLQGIGEATAEKIIQYREEHGDFKQIEDLKNVSGIGDAKFDAIKDSIRVK